MTLTVGCVLCTCHLSGMNTDNSITICSPHSSKAKNGKVYNIGGSNERRNIDVTKDLIGLVGHKNPDDHITFVPDRVFNDFRYHINSDRLFELGWRELVSWEVGLKRTFDWYKTNSDRFGNIDSALEAHPRAGLDHDAV